MARSADDSGELNAFGGGLSTPSDLSQQPGYSLPPRPLYSPTPVTAGATARDEATERRGPQERPLDRRRQGFPPRPPSIAAAGGDRPRSEPLASAKFSKIFRICFPDFPLYGVEAARSVR